MDYFSLASLLCFIYAIVVYAIQRFITPSIVFSTMWGLSCMLCSLDVNGHIEGVSHTFTFVSNYIPFFILSSLVGFLLARIFSQSDSTYRYIHIDISQVQYLLEKYRWILYLSFFVGLFRIIAIVALFGVSNLMEFRLISLSFDSYSPLISLVLRIGNYANLFASSYLILFGFYHGRTSVDTKLLLQNLLLYSMMGISTGGRLFIFYFLIYYTIPFILGRYIRNYSLYTRSIAEKPTFLSRREWVNLSLVMISLITLISIIGLLRAEDPGNSESSPLYKFLYLCDGIISTDWALENYKNFSDFGYGINSLFDSKSETMLEFRNQAIKSPIAFMVFSVMIPLYFDFGWWGSIFIWGLTCFIIEYLSLRFLRNFTILKLLMFAFFARFMYESIVFQPFSSFIPVLQLLFLLYVFRSFIFVTSYTKK